jgi:hypothetical protein
MIDLPFRSLATLVRISSSAAITLADLTTVERREPRGSRAGGRASWPGWSTEVVSSPVVPVLSFLTGLQGRLDLRGLSVPARVQRPLVMG